MADPDVDSRDEGVQSTRKKISLLIVDDEDNFLFLAKHFLEGTGEFRVDTTPSAQDALHVLSVQPYDAIVSDYQMPGMDGIALLEVVRQRFGDIPFILFTIRSRDEVIIDAINKGADNYIQKSANHEAQFADLAHKIKQAVNRKKTKLSLLDQEKYISDILDFLPDATFAIDHTGQVIAWNRAIEEMTGTLSRDILGKGDYEYAIPFYGYRRPILIDFIDESDEKIAQFYSNGYRDGNSLMAETDLSHPKGNQISALVKVCRFYNKEGEIIGAIESIRDITKLKKIEQNLRESEERFRGMAERSSDLIIILNKDMSPTYISPSARSIIGYDPEELVGESVAYAAASIFSQSGLEFMNGVQKTLQGKFIDNLEMRILRKDGNLIEANVSAVPIIIDGILSGAQVTIHDISEQKRIESATRAMMMSMVETTGYHSLRHITETIRAWLSADGVLFGEILPGNNRIQVLSMVLDDQEVPPFSYDIKGTPCEQVIGSGFSLYEDNVSIFFPDCKKLAELHVRGYLGTPLRNSEGKVFGTLCVLFRNPIKISTYVHQIIDIIAVKAAADIERSHIEQTLRESQQMLAEAMDLAHLVNWEYDVRSDLFTFDDRFYAMYGTTAEHEGGYQMSSAQYATNFVHPGDMGLVAEEVEKAILATDPHFVSQREHRIIRRDGEIRYIIVRFGITKDDQGKTIQTRGANQDITDRKKAELALRQANRQLNLLSSITRHDILNMITVLLLYLEGLEMTCSDQNLCATYQKMQAATKKIQSQIEFTRVYEDLGIHEPTWQELRAVMHESDLPAAISMTTQLHDISIFADPMLEKVFFNFLDNSERHGQRVTEIRVYVQPSDNELTILWEDNGVGIPDDEKKLIFERGFGKNTGLGMFLAREILALTGISLQETGVFGKGVRFEIVVPKGGWRMKESSAA